MRGQSSTTPSVAGLDRAGWRDRWARCVREGFETADAGDQEDAELAEGHRRGAEPKGGGDADAGGYRSDQGEGERLQRQRAEPVVGDDAPERLRRDPLGGGRLVEDLGKADGAAADERAGGDHGGLGGNREQRHRQREDDDEPLADQQRPARADREGDEAAGQPADAP